MAGCKSKEYNFTRLSLFSHFTNSRVSPVNKGTSDLHLLWTKLSAGPNSDITTKAFLSAFSVDHGRKALGIARYPFSTPISRSGMGALYCLASMRGSFRRSDISCTVSRQLTGRNY